MDVLHHHWSLAIKKGADSSVFMLVFEISRNLDSPGPSTDSKGKYDVE